MPGIALVELKMDIRVYFRGKLLCEATAEYGDLEELSGLIIHGTLDHKEGILEAYLSVDETVTIRTIKASMDGTVSQIVLDNDRYQAFVAL